MLLSTAASIGSIQVILRQCCYHCTPPIPLLFQHVRELSRQQFMARATIMKARTAAGLPPHGVPTWDKTGRNCLKNTFCLHSINNSVVHVCVHISFDMFKLIVVRICLLYKLIMPISKTCGTNEHVFAHGQKYVPGENSNSFFYYIRHL